MHAGRSMDRDNVTAQSLEQWRAPLTGYCYRMLASPFDAEDAVQETFIKAWRNAHAFDAAKGSLKGWLFQIATNVCLDMMRGRQRRARAMDLASPSRPGPDVGAPVADHSWVEPAPDAFLWSAPAADPATEALRSESVRLAFLAAMQVLPARQRAVLIMRDVLAMHAAEVAHVLETSVASTNSALQRARDNVRGTLSSAKPAPVAEAGVDDQLLTEYCAAFEAYDVPALIRLMHREVQSSMPPYLWWLDGRDDVEASMSVPNPYCYNALALPTRANESPAFGQYFADRDGGHRAFALVVLTTNGHAITDVTTYLEAERFFPLFNLPLTLTAGSSPRESVRFRDELRPSSRASDEFRDDGAYKPIPPKLKGISWAPTQR